MTDTGAYTFGTWLRHRRRSFDWTQADLARRVNCTAAMIRKLEADERRPSPQLAELLAEALRVPAAERAAFLRAARHAGAVEPLLSINLTPLAGRTPHNLPAPLTSFIGREVDVAKVGEYLARPDIRLVTLIGPPGIGKTRLSLQLAHEARANFADGVFFVPLAPIDEPDLAAPAIVQALGLVQTDQRSELERLKDGINDRQLLIVLDNFEQIAEGAAPLIPELLMACLRLKILITSRESLRVPGEWLYPVPPLSTPDEHLAKNSAAEAFDRFSALRLFAERAQAVRPEFALTPENIQPVAAICHRLDGLPLAIELIAARIRLMSPQVLLSRLTSDFMLHADGMRGVPNRQKTLHDAIAWSYDLLNRDEQVLLARLSAFAGGFTLDAAQAITQTPNAIAGLTSLLDKSLLVRTFDVTGAARFSLLMMIHDFARARLREMSEESSVRDRHAGYFLKIAEEADGALHGPQETVWLKSLELEHENLLTSLAWLLDREESNLEEGLWLAAALGDFWYIRGYWTEGLQWLNRALTKADEHFPLVRARLLLLSGRLLIRRGDIGQALNCLQESLALYKEAGDKRGIARALEWLGFVAERQGNVQQEKALYEQSLALFQSANDQPGIAYLLVRLGYIAQQENDLERAASLLEESLILSQATGDKTSSAFALRYLGWIAFAKANLDQATKSFQSSLTLVQELNDKGVISGILNDLGELARVQGDYVEAAKCYEESLQLSQELGIKSRVPHVLHNLGHVALRRQDTWQARLLFEKALTTYRMADDEDDIIALCLRGLGGVASTRGEFERATRLFGAAEALLRAEKMNPADLLEYNRHLARVRDQLVDITLESLLAEGRAMTIEQAIEYALSGETGLQQC
jgi:predicted ATPase/transcriptional regulator with XRE-family HTH domain